MCWLQDGENGAEEDGGEEVTNGGGGGDGGPDGDDNIYEKVSDKVTPVFFSSFLLCMLHMQC